MKNQISIENLTGEQIKLLKEILSQANDKKSGLDLSVRSFADEYLKYAEQSFSQKYYKSIECSLNHLINYFDERLISELTVKDIENFIVFLRRSAPKGSVVYYRNLKAAFNKALDWEYLKINPFTKIKMVKNMQTRPDFLNETELQRVIENLNNQTIKNIALTAYYTGCRLNEVLSLRVKNINLQEKTVTVGDSEFMTKSKKQRIIPICDKLLDMLGELLSEKSGSNSFVFGKTDNVKFNPDYISKTFKMALRRADLRESLHFHSLRHSFGSTLGQKGVPMITVKELMGHSSITTTQIYSHTTLNDMRRAITNFN